MSAFVCTVNSVLSPFICLIFDSNPITFSTDQSSLSLPSWLAIIMSKYFVIPSDLFLAVMPGQWYTCLDTLRHAIIGIIQHTYHFSTVISLWPESQTSLEKIFSTSDFPHAWNKLWGCSRDTWDRGRGNPELTETDETHVSLFPFLG